MHGMSGACVLLAVCLMGRPWRCAAECDANIENKIKAEHRDPLEFSGIYETLTGEYQIVLMSSGKNIVDKQAQSCLRMEFINNEATGEFQLKYTDIENSSFIVIFNDGALIAKARDDKGIVTLTHRIVFFAMEVIAFYACSDAGNDPPLSVVAVASWYSKAPYLVAHRIQKAKEALESVGVHGFATIPYCPQPE